MVVPLWELFDEDMIPVTPPDGSKRKIESDAGIGIIDEGAAMQIHSRNEAGNADTARMQTLALPAPPTVLIVDDDDLVLERLAQLVSSSGYRVHTTTSGFAALSWLQSSHASIVVTDVNMPAIGGLELCRRIRALNRPDYVYLILLTVSDDEKDILAGFDAGADDYISKQTSVPHFKARLRTANRILALEYTLKNELQKRQVLAMTDELTGVYNRRYFTKRLSAVLKRLNAPGARVSVLLVDVDHFKKVNEGHGHAAGDLVLKGITREMSACLRDPNDWCARLGGEEFVLVLEGSDLAEAGVCAERIRRSIEKAWFGNARKAIRVTVSIGISGSEELAGQNPAAPADLLAIADKNLFVSKSGGRNRVTWSMPVEASTAPVAPASVRTLHAGT
jgi:two-component system cell cycle response regulator